MRNDDKEEAISSTQIVARMIDGVIENGVKVSQEMSDEDAKLSNSFKKVGKKFRKMHDLISELSKCTKLDKDDKKQIKEIQTMRLRFMLEQEIYDKRHQKFIKEKTEINNLILKLVYIRERICSIKTIEDDESCSKYISSVINDLENSKKKIISARNML